MGKSSSKQQPQNLAPSTLIPMGQTNPMFQPQHHIIPMPCTQNQTFPSQLTSFVPMFPEQWFVPPSITPFTTTRAPVMFDDAVLMDQRVRHRSLLILNVTASNKMGKSSSKQQPQNLAPSTLIPMGPINPMFQPQHHIIPMPCTQNQTFPSQLTSFVPMFPEQWFVPPSITPFTTTRAPVMFDDAVQMDQGVRRY
ncbi:hypothetical protein ACOME3_003144 [Neoechinorhynchus agilis]